MHPRCFAQQSRLPSAAASAQGCGGGGGRCWVASASRPAMPSQFWRCMRPIERWLAMPLHPGSRLVQEPTTDYRLSAPPAPASGTTCDLHRAQQRCRLGDARGAPGQPADLYSLDLPSENWPDAHGEGGSSWQRRYFGGGKREAPPSNDSRVPIP